VRPLRNVQLVQTTDMSKSGTEYILRGRWGKLTINHAINR